MYGIAHMDSINNVSNNTIALKPMVPADTDPKTKKEKTKRTKIKGHSN